MTRTLHWSGWPEASQQKHPLDLTETVRKHSYSCSKTQRHFSDEHLNFTSEHLGADDEDKLFIRFYLSEKTSH